MERGALTVGTGGFGCHAIGATGQAVGIPRMATVLTVATVTLTSDAMEATRTHRRSRHRGAGRENASPDAPVYTIDELAAATGVPSRTVRHYQWVGALQPPARKGRIALYREEHLQRLQLIGKLQDRGYGSPAIGATGQAVGHLRPRY